MNYEKMWWELKNHLIDTMEQIDTKDVTGLFAVAGLGNALIAMECFETGMMDEESEVQE